MTPLDSYHAARSRLDEEMSRLDEGLRVLQKSCDHPPTAQVEAEYYSDGAGFVLEPFAVCTVCGYSEGLWSGGNDLLRHPARGRVTRELGLQLARPDGPGGRR